MDMQILGRLVKIQLSSFLTLEKLVTCLYVRLDAVKGAKIATPYHI